MLEIIRKTHRLLSTEQWPAYLLVQLIFLLTAIIQVAGAASLAPFIGLLANPATIHTNFATKYVYDFFNCTSDVQFLMLFACAVMATIVISNAIAALSTWMMFSFSFKLGAELQEATYRSYLNKDFIFYSQQNSSNLIGMLTQEIPRFVFMVMQPFLNLCSQTFIATIILAGLIYIDITLAGIATAIIGGGYFLVFKLLRENLEKHGHNLWLANNKKLKLLTESLGGIKEIKLLGYEKIYEEQLDEVNKSNLNSQSIIGLSAEMPRFIIETIAFCGLLSLALYLLSKYGSSPKVISVLSLYAMAGYKLLPAAQTIYKSIANMRANGSSIDGFLHDVKEGRTLSPADKSNIAPLGSADGIRLENLSYHYPETDAPALRDINLAIPACSVISLVGYSGAGKSTLADIILGLLTPTKGKLWWGDTEIEEHNLANWQRSLGYVPQNIFIIDDTIKANIAFGVPADKIDMNKVKQAARMANIEQFIDSLSDGYDYWVGERGAMLSGGQRQRIGIARALYHDADILIFDEATSALDSVTESEIIATIDRLRSVKTIIMIAHRLATVKISNMIVILNRGEIEETGTFEQLCKTSAKFREMLHLDASGHPEADQAAQPVS